MRISPVGIGPFTALSVFCHCRKSSQVSIELDVVVRKMVIFASGNGNHSVSLPIILIEIKVDQMLPSSYLSSLLVPIL